MNSFTINYDEKIVCVYYNFEKFSFNLDDGDVGDFWNSFTTDEGVIKDVNFFQEDESMRPCLSLYDLDDEGYIDTSTEEEVYCAFISGNPNNYFNQYERKESNL